MPPPEAGMSFTRLLARCLRKTAWFVESPYRAISETLINTLTWVANYIENPTPPNRWFMKGLFAFQSTMALGVLIPAAMVIHWSWRGYWSYDVYGSYMFNGLFVRSKPSFQALMMSRLILSIIYFINGVLQIIFYPGNPNRVKICAGIGVLGFFAWAVIAGVSSSSCNNVDRFDSTLSIFCDLLFYDLQLITFDGISCFLAFAVAAIFIHSLRHPHRGRESRVVENDPYNKAQLPGTPNMRSSLDSVRPSNGNGTTCTHFLLNGQLYELHAVVGVPEVEGTSRVELTQGIAGITELPCEQEGRGIQGGSETSEPEQDAPRSDGMNDSMRENQDEIHSSGARD